MTVGDPDPRIDRLAALAQQGPGAGQVPIPIAQLNVQFQRGPAKLDGRKIEAPGAETVYFLIMSTPAAVVGGYWTAEGLDSIIARLQEVRSGLTIARDVPPSGAPEKP